ncbi:hypothetical protein TcasGA2_TC003885 [Tribolium castaneum]|uniref:Uncharacterized protein n=1 Tax=Tribolium castaneum TaxID=7070 RepID=D6WH56_TRICA|nr:hypothetical protein TcasGA2_TC003885 [Tribolium castaneum]
MGVNFNSNLEMRVVNDPRMLRRSGPMTPPYRSGGDRHLAECGPENFGTVGLDPEMAEPSFD